MIQNEKTKILNKVEINSNKSMITINVNELNWPLSEQVRFKIINK